MTFSLINISQYLSYSPARLVFMHQHFSNKPVHSTQSNWIFYFLIMYVQRGNNVQEKKILVGLWKLTVAFERSGNRPRLHGVQLQLWKPGGEPPVRGQSDQEKPQSGQQKRLAWASRWSARISENHPGPGQANHMRIFKSSSCLWCEVHSLMGLGPAKQSQSGRPGMHH